MMDGGLCLAGIFKIKVQCAYCHKTIDLESLHVGRRDECPHCSADLHSCKACKFYDTTAYNECREPMADRITEKEKSNFCDYYQIKTEHGATSQEDHLKAAMELFKKK